MNQMLIGSSYTIYKQKYDIGPTLAATRGEQDQIKIKSPCGYHVFDFQSDHTTLKMRG